jgi:hypothetical protein
MRLHVRAARVVGQRIDAPSRREALERFLASVSPERRFQKLRNVHRYVCELTLPLFRESHS